jgi:hypothetical protein
MPVAALWKLPRLCAHASEPVLSWLSYHFDSTAGGSRCSHPPHSPGAIKI